GMIRFLTEILCLTLCFGVFFNGECRILKDWQNIVKSEEEEKKIEELDVNKGGCNISAGWNLTGRDLGCCGNYEGCCRIASKVCYLHDSICQCCRLGWIFCGPECKPETECLLTTEKIRIPYQAFLQNTRVCNLLYNLFENTLELLI
uniref:Uncharacterized protein n=1 Tax=Magallana gigas TaxID=29159 RepID=A0A8W8NNJ5_MAGGI